MSEYTGKYRKRLPRLTAVELEQYRADSHREKVLAIQDYVVCRECGRRMQYIGTAHLRTHDLSAKEYGKKWPGAPLYSPLAKGRRLENQRNWVSRQDSEELKKYKHAEYMANRQERIAAATKWQNEHRDSHNKSCANWRASDRGKKLTRERKQRWQAKVQQALAKLKPQKPPHRPQGSQSEDTSGRVTVIAYWQLQGLKPYQITPHAYPLQHNEDAARNNIKSFVRRQSSAIRERMEQLAELQPAERAVLAEQAERELRTT